MPITLWSTTASDNDDADIASGIDWRENQLPGTVNNSARGMMAVIKGDFANSLLTAAGYQKFPNGLILQWGQSINGSLADYSISYPVAFPVATLSACATPLGTVAADAIYSVAIASANTTTISFRTRSAANGGSVGSAPGMLILWMAIGC